MNNVRYGIIGFGAFAERAILPAIRSSPNSVVTAIQKRSLAEAEAKRREHGVPFAFDSAEALCASAEVDAVFIVSSNARHHPETLIAARHGKHVLTEKPMALSAAQGREMAEACRTAGVKFMVGHMLRFSPLVRRMHELVSSGALGDITAVRAEFFYDAGISHRRWLWNAAEAGGGPLFDVGIHCLDTVRFVLGDPEAAEVTGMTRDDGDGTRVERSSLMNVRFRTGTLCSVYSSFEAPYRRTFIEFIGSRGTLSAFNFTPSRVTAVLEWTKGAEGLPAETLREPFDVPDLYEAEVSHFSRCVLTGEAPAVRWEESVRNQEILDAALIHRR